MGISTNQLTEYRRIARTVLQQSCEITRNTYTDTDTGGWSESEGTVASSVACRLSRRGYQELFISPATDVVQPTWEYKLKVAHDQAIEPDDFVTMDDTGHKYRVESVNDDHEWITVKTCQVTRVE
jgi:hypothetical protein